MAFNVTPASGAGPYTLELDLANKTLIDGINYELEAFFSTGTGECPVVGTSPGENIRDALLSVGSYVRTMDVTQGDCLVYTVKVVSLKDSVILSQQTVSIDNT